MDMAWHTAPQKVRAVSITWTNRPSKCGHKRSIMDAHRVHRAFRIMGDLRLSQHSGLDTQDFIYPLTVIGVIVHVCPSSLDHSREPCESSTHSAFGYW